MTLDIRTVRPVDPVQAVQVTRDNCHEVVDWVRSLGPYGAHAYDGQPAVWLQQDNSHGRQTLAAPGDWVVADLHGPVVVHADDYPGKYTEERS